MPSAHEIIDIVQLPDLLPTGETKPIMRAIEGGGWLSVFATWLNRTTFELAILFQGRSLQAMGSPGILDISAAGHYNAGQPLSRTVTLANFFYNIDDYHFRNAERLYLYLCEGWL